MSDGETDEVFLDDTWSLYFHDPQDSDWRLSSYVKITDVSSANEFWGVANTVGNRIGNGMFFLMREHVFPCWDDKYNIQGGCLSIKVANDAVARTWNELCTEILGEGMEAECAALAAEHGATGATGATGGAAVEINGISVSPKYNFAIIKLWLSSARMQEPRLRPASLRDDSFFRLNLQSLHSGQAQQAAST